MCSLCLNSPCNPRCPNAPEPIPVYICDRCGDGIFDGDKFYDGPDGYICQDCIKDMSVEDFMEIMGEKLSTAEKEE